MRVVGDTACTASPIARTSAASPSNANARQRASSAESVCISDTSCLRVRAFPSFAANASRQCAQWQPHPLFDWLSPAWWPTMRMSSSIQIEYGFIAAAYSAAISRM